MRYADTLLADGERVALRSRQHWLATVLDARYPWLLVLFGVLLLVLQAIARFEGAVSTILGWVTAAVWIVGLAWLAKVYWNWWAQDYLVTNRRVIKVEGILNKRSADSSLEKINDAVLEQNLFGRIFGYGDLDILTGQDITIDKYRMLDQAPTFKKVMLNMKHELEQEYIRPAQPPTPPFRAPAPVATPSAELSVPAAPAAAPVAGSAAALGGPQIPAPHQMTPDEVTATLTRLADLRDRGAISPEEYEAKKAELLARL
ncbi:MAG: PH domain-containing protein [Candidatus Limnocylindrales bacterium]